MLQLLPIVKLIALAVAGWGAAMVVMKILNLAVVMGWVKERSHLKLEDADVIAGTIAEVLESGNYREIPFFFDQQEKKLIDAQIYEAEELDEQLQDLHEDTPMVVLT